jgi:hypothetical protein
MKLDLKISYEVEDADSEATAILEGIVDDEARQFAHTVGARLESEGVRIQTLQVEGGDEPPEGRQDE